MLNVLKTPATAPSVVGPLSTSGNQIMQANGQPVTLRGLVMPGLEQKGTLTGTGVSEQAIIEAEDWGANFVRVPLGGQFWLSSNCDYVPGYVYAVNQVVKSITSLGMVALLDLHTNTVGGCQAGTEHNMADEAQAPTFWSEVAQRYGNPASPEYSPLVAFDLYNEPHDFRCRLAQRGQNDRQCGGPGTRPRACSSSTTRSTPPGQKTWCSSAASTGPAPLRRPS